MDFPLAEVIRKASIISSHGDLNVYQKFTCCACGKRNTSKVPNSFLPIGRCTCGQITDLTRTGCNYGVANVAARRA